MKIKLNTQPQGSALIVTLLTAMVIGISLASYLTLVSSQNVSTMRSLAWNATIPVLESGVEEALTHIHIHLYDHVQNEITDLTGNGWTLEADGWYHKKRVMGANYYETAIQPVNPPVITSIGYVPAPLTPSSQLGMILGGLLPPMPGDSNTGSTSYVSRRVRVTTKGLPRFDKAMAADGLIDLKGNNVESDSFDSSDPAYSTLGNYDAAKAKDNGDIATNSGLVNSISTGNANIKGRVSTGPGGSVSIGSNGSVGSKAWVESGNTGVEAGHLSDDMNIEFPDVEVPFTGGYSTPIGGTVLGVGYNYVLGTGNYKLSSFSGKVLVTGDATLWVTDSVNFSGNDKIEIAPGARLRLFVSASSATIGGSGVVNSTGNAVNFQYYGLPSNTSLTYSGNGSVSGVIYAPQAAFNLGGGGNNTYDFVGGSVTATVSINGHYNFHYDEALKKGPAREYVITSWNEI